MRPLLVLVALLAPLPVASAQWTDGAYNPYGEVPVRVHVDASNLTAETARYLDEARDALRFWERGGNGALRWNVTFLEVERPEEAHLRVWFVDAAGVPCGGRLAAGCGGFRMEEDGSNLSGIAVAAMRAGAPGASVEGPSPDARYLPYATIRQTMAHEVGHALGLRHSEVFGDVMYRHVTANGFADAPGDTWLQRNPLALAGLVLLLGVSPFLAWRAWRQGSRFYSGWRERRAMALGRRGRD